MRVVLADDSILFREGVARVLRDGGFTVLGQAGDGEALFELTRRTSPDVAIVDIRMPPTYTTEGLLAATRIRADNHQVGVLVLSHYVETSHVVQLLGEDAAGVGYLLKDRIAEIDEFLGAVRRVGTGGSVIDPALISRLMTKQRTRNPLDGLTERERHVLALMAEGRSNKAVSEHLHISGKTLESHVRSIFMKLELENAPNDHRRVLAVLAYLRSI